VVDKRIAESRVLNAEMVFPQDALIEMKGAEIYAETIPA